MSSGIPLFTKGLGVACVALSLSAFSATHYVSPDGNHTAPFLTWETAATNIQSAIASTTAGDLVLVTNGIYATGGARASESDTQTNRVAVTNAIIVQSVNGPKVTIIEGAWTPGTTNGAQSIRCVYLSAGATLDGFTLRNGSTTTYGGGALNSLGTITNSPATITNCIVTGNAARLGGGGVYGGRIHNSLIEGNTSFYMGGGADYCNVRNSILRLNTAINGGGACYVYAVNCAFIGNVADIGGGFAFGTVGNCTIVQNTARTKGGGYYDGFGGSVTNSIIYYNFAPDSPNYWPPDCRFISSCTSPMPQSPGNISADPRLLPDLIHLQPDSPCLGKGVAYELGGVDIDGTPWTFRPSMGCDEWTPALIKISASLQPIPAATLGDVVMSYSFAGETPSCQWFKDDVLLSSGPKYAASESSQLLVRNFGPSDAGAYQLVATNAYGAITTAVMRVNVACVDLQSVAPAAPYASWATAATNIQEAIDSAHGTTVILVTNGVYDTGAIDISGLGQSRVVLNGAVTVMSVNGPAQTIIQGAWDPATTNGPASVRCVVIGPDSYLRGFTLRNGSTTSSGGGIASLMRLFIQPQIFDCMITNCSAKGEGGGAFGVGVADCIFKNNTSGTNGGGMCAGAAWRSDFVGNSSKNGAGAYGCLLETCQIVGNFGSGVHGGEITRSMIATNSGNGVVRARAENCRIVGNKECGVKYSLVLGSLIKGNYAIGSDYSININCTIVANREGDGDDSRSTNCIFAFNYHPGVSPKWYSIDQPGGYGSPPALSSFILHANLLTDLEHIAVNSPCIGRGTGHGLVKFDIDGQPFKDPPAMGCDEWYPDIMIAAQPRIIPGDLPGEAVLLFDLVGDSARCWWSKDGAPVQPGEHYASVTSSSLRIRNFGPLDVGDYQVVASNSFGVVTSAVVHVKFACVDPHSLNPIAPFHSWQTAATTIQEAVDTADLETVVVVTNGIYATGTRAVGSDTPNRLVVDKPIALISANGADHAIIEGAWDPASTNGPASVRCAWLSSEAMMGGFTFRNGSSYGDGGGIWVPVAAGPTVNLNYCVVTNCSSKYYGGGVYQGRVQNSLITGNIANWRGGGTYRASLDNCLVRLNIAKLGGGVAYGIARGCRISENVASDAGGGVKGAILLSCSIAFNAAPVAAGVSGSGMAYVVPPKPVPMTTAFHCTIVSNTAWASALAGADDIWLYNSIVYHNAGIDDPATGSLFENMSSYTNPEYVCSPFPTNSTTGYVLNALPQLLDSAHLASTSPCIAAGASLGNLGFDDIDGEPWGAKPSMGCDEFYPSGLVGPLSVTVIGWPKVAAGGSMPLAALIDGKATGVQWNFGDGIVTNQVGYNPSRAWSAPGNYTVTATVYNTDHAEGISASLPVEVIPLTIPELGQPEISGNNFQMSFSSQPGLTYEVYTATNLAAPIDWKLLKRLYSTGDAMSVTDTNAPAPAKFYRLEVKP